MKKKIPMIAFALLMSAVLFSACNRNESRIDKPTVQNKTTAQEATTENKTEKETTTEPQNVVHENGKTEIFTKTDFTTDVVSDPTKPATSSDTEASVNFLYEPEKIVFCHDGKPQTLTKEMNEEVIKEINSYLRNDYKGGGWKYAAEESMINEIKSHIHIEIYYDSVQMFSTASSTDERKYNHLLVSLEGQYKNIIFFGKDGKYMSIPIGPLYDDDFSENILRHIFDE